MNGAAASAETPFATRMGTAFAAWYVAACSTAGLSFTPTSLPSGRSETSVPVPTTTRWRDGSDGTAPRPPTWISSQRLGRHSRGYRPDRSRTQFRTPSIAVRSVIAPPIVLSRKTAVANGGRWASVPRDLVATESSAEKRSRV